MCNSHYITHQTKSGLFFDPWNQEQKSQLNLYNGLQSQRKPFYWTFKRQYESVLKDIYTEARDRIGDNPRLDLMQMQGRIGAQIDEGLRPIYRDFHVNTGAHFARQAYTSSRNYKDKLIEARVIRSSSGKVIETDHYFQKLEDVFVIVDGKRRNVNTFDGHKIILTESITVSEGDKVTVYTKDLSDSIMQVIRDALLIYSTSALGAKLLSSRQSVVQLFQPANIQAQIDLQSKREVQAYISRLISRDARERAARAGITEVTQASNHGLQLGAQQVSKDAKKTWISRLDDRVRETHGPLLQDQDGNVLMGADGLEVPVGQPYVIRDKRGGYDRLRFPGDTSLGASLSNIINCRCYEQFSL